MTRTELVRLARSGAEMRLRALQDEIGLILKQFPDLRSAHRSGSAGHPHIVTVSRTIKKPRRGLSAAGRRAIQLAQKKRWAEWKAKHKNAS
jgi:hypothetical protein